MKFGAQLYTLREQVKTAEGFRNALKRVSEMGYEGVQISAVAAFQTEVTPETTKEWLSEFGLVCCATHRPWDNLQNKLDEEIGVHHTIGCGLIGIGMAPGYCYEGEMDGWRKFIAQLPPLLDKLNSADIDFAFHNHAIEWQIQGGDRGMRLLMEEADPRLQFIVDTYWVVHAGVDVVPHFEKLKGRVKVIHLKDKSVHKWETRMAPVGEGNLTWEKILPAVREAGTEWGVVEQDDCYGEDPYLCLEKSLKNLKKWSA